MTKLEVVTDELTIARWKRYQAALALDKVQVAYQKAKRADSEALAYCESVSELYQECLHSIAVGELT